MSQPASDYYLRPRREVANLVPPSCRTILEIGPGFGALGRALAAREGVSVDAVEINPAAASHLQGVYRRFVIGDIETLDLGREFPGPYDCVICADVLEHLVDPWLVLERLVSLLRPGGHVVLSIPNVRNLAPLYRLVVHGEWQYTDSGLLDRTHLRFFTRKGVQALVDGAGLVVERWEVNTDRYSGVRGVVSAAMRAISIDFAVCQHLVLARKR